LSELKKFTSLLYKNVNFLIPNDSIFTASCCDEQSFVKDERGLDSKIKFADKELNFIDFDDCVRLFNTTAEKNHIHTTLIIKNNGLYEDEEYYALLTSADCRVVFIEESVFTSPGAFYDRILDKIGVKACYFGENIINYHIDVNKFFGNVYEKNTGC